MGKRVVTGSLGWVSARLGAQALEFAAWALLARELGAARVGEVAVAAIAARMFGLLGDWGAAFRGPRDVVREGRNSSLVLSLVRRRELVSIVLATTMVFGTVGSGYVELAPMALAVVARGANRDWIALGEGRRFAAAIPPLVQGTLICGLVLLISSPAGAATVIGLGSATGLVTSIALNRVSVGSGRLAPVAIDGWYLLAGITDQILVSADTLLLALLGTAGDAGVYASLYRLPLAWVMVVGLSTTAAIPIATRLIGSGQVPARVAHSHADKVAALLAVASIPVTLLGLAAASPIFGAEFEVGRSALLLLFLATAATATSAPYRVLYTALGPDRRVGLVTTLAAAVNLVANVGVIGRWGMEGAATTTLVTQLGMLAFFWSWSRSERRKAAPIQALSPVG